VKQFMRDNPEVARAIEQKVRLELGMAKEETAIA
jgi:hypothetical protein